MIDYNLIIEKGKVFDLEIYPDFFLAVSKDIKTGEIDVVSINKFEEPPVEKLNQFLMWVVNRPMIGYNCNRFDFQVIAYLITQFVPIYYTYYTNADVEDSARILALKEVIDRYILSGKLYDFVNENLIGAGIGHFSDKPVYDIRKFVKFPIDLFLMFHFDNEALRTSLKWIEFSLNQEKIESIPFSGEEKLTKSKIKSIIDYCVNDVETTYSLFKLAIGETNHPLYKGKNEILNRVEIANAYFNGNFDVLSWSDVKIGERFVINEYCKKVNLSVGQLWEIKRANSRPVKPRYTYEEFFPSYIKDNLNMLSDEMRNHFDSIARMEVQLPAVSVDADGVQKKSVFYDFIYDGNRYSVGRGGLHTINDPFFYKQTGDIYITTADVESMYPNAIRKLGIYPYHLGKEWNEVYSGLIPQKVNASRLYDETKNPIYESKKRLFKYALNGTYGKLGDITSLFFDPYCVLQTTIACQMDMLFLIDLLHQNGIHVITANTDGLECLVSGDEMLKKYKEICDMWERIVGNDQEGKLKHGLYTLYVGLSVNHYIAVSQDGKVKKKGMFSTEYELNKNKSAAIVPKLIEQYYVKGLSINNFKNWMSDYIKENKENIFDFMLAVKANKDFHYELYDPEKKTKKKLKNSIVRYYLANPGYILLKIRNDDSKSNFPKISRVEAEFLVRECNQFDVNNYKLEKLNLDLNAYYKLAVDMIREIESSKVVQLSIF